MQKLTAGNPAIEHRQKTLKDLADIRKKQASLRQELSFLIQEGKLDKGTREYLSGQLQFLSGQEEQAKSTLADEQAFEEKYNNLHKRIAEFHRQCREWKENLDNPRFIPSFQFWCDACQFLGISVTVWKSGTEPPYTIDTDPPDIVELLSERRVYGPAAPSSAC